MISVILRIHEELLQLSNEQPTNSKVNRRLENRHFCKEDIPRSTWKNARLPLTCRKKQIETTMRIHFRFIRMAIIKQKTPENSKCWWGCKGIGTLMNCWWKYQAVWPLWKTVATPWTVTHQAPLSSTVSWSLLRLMSIESMMLSNISSFAAPFSFCPPSFPASGFFPTLLIDEKKWALGGSVSKQSACNAGDMGSILESGKIPWRKKWQPTPVFLTGKFHGQRSLAGYSSWGHKSWTWLSN